ncbi:MAG: hypothetical protein ACI4MQ_01805 [Candidatus Coproplasma sp.]
MKKLITSIVLSTALVGGACMATGCTSVNSNSTGNDVATVEELNSATEFYTYGAASIGSIISAAEAAEAAPETPAEGEEGTTETPETPAEGEEGTTETPETPAEGEEGTTETPETPAEGEEGTTETPEVPEVPAEPETPEVPETPTEPETPEQTTDGLTEGQLATVNSYMGLVENLLANGGLSYIRTESDREGYEVKEVISFSDLEGNVITYVMYYNSTLDYVETDFDDDKEETESKYTIEGIMIIDGEEYALEGYSEVEISEKESESETYFKVTLADGSYIIMEQEAEADETELVYKVVQDKKVVEKIKFEYETEHGETELKMSVEKDGVKTELKFTEETEQGVKVIKVTAKGGESQTSFKIVVTQDEEGNNVYQYTFGDKIKEMQRHHFEKGHFDDVQWGDLQWNHGEWHQGNNGKWQWHVEDKDRTPVELPEIPELPAEGEEGTIETPELPELPELPAEELIPQDVETQIIEQIKDFVNKQGGYNKH